MTAARCRSLRSIFGLPSGCKYPMDMPGRAANAKARITQHLDRIEQLLEANAAAITCSDLDFTERIL